MTKATFRMIIRMKLFLLSFGAGLYAARESQDYDKESFETTRSVNHNFDQIFRPSSSIQATQENETFQNEDSNTFPENRIFKNISSINITEMLRGISSCRQKYLKKRNRKLGFRQHEGSTYRARAWFGRNPNISVFHCNISKELVDGLKDKLHQLEMFQDIIVLYPKNHSLNADRFSASKAPTESKKYKSFVRNKNVPSRRERDMLLKNDQVESNIKVLQMSHIYLGRSLYPLFTEESRVIGRNLTLPPPVFTGSTYSYDDERLTTSEAYKLKMKG